MPRAALRYGITTPLAVERKGDGSPVTSRTAIIETPIAPA